MPSQYVAETPIEPQVPDSLVKFFETFYQISDTPDAHEKYADCFTKGGVMVLASAKVEGREGLLSLRQKMWSAVSSRSHYPTKIFPFKGGASSTSAEREVMIYGTVSYGLKAGGSDEKEWAARAVLVRDGEGVEEGRDEGMHGWRMTFYQVYLDTGAKK